MNGSPLTMLSNIFTRSPVPSSSNPVPSSSSSPVWIVTLLASQTLQLRMAPYCYICSYRQPTGPQRRVNHRHSSSREVRLMQGVDFSTQALTYMCPTCMEAHNTWPEYGLNVCLGTSHLHNVHHPMDPTVTCPPDPLHQGLPFRGGMGGGHRTEEVCPPPSEVSPPPMVPPPTWT